MANFADVIYKHPLKYPEPHLWIDCGVSEDVKKSSVGLKGVSGSEVGRLLIRIKIGPNDRPSTGVHFKGKLILFIDIFFKNTF